jgi:dihydrofolate synthase/folylpolyglutamate synthase
MNYSQAEEYLHRFIDYEKNPGISYASPDYSLKHVEELLHRMGDPHLAAKTVHIAGTKGKGSIAAMIAQVLTVSGYKTGLYTSPHLHTLRERIRIDGSLISQAEFAALAAEVKPYFEAINRDPLYRQLTFFEALTVLAFAYFKQRQADFQVLEVGLGGRLDATNVVKPEVCVISTISLDHTQVLGDSLDEIAYEKAGIIKPGCVVVSSPQPEEVTSVIGKVCHRQGGKLIQMGKDVTWRKMDAGLCHQSFLIESEMDNHCFTIPLLGDFQVENAATAVATLEVLASLGFDISAEDIAQGLAEVEWPGRFQILNHQPLVVVDGAHNVASMGRLAENIKAYFNYEQIFLIFGVACDKDIGGIVRELTQLSPRVIVTRSSSPRAASPAALAAEFSKWGINPKIADTVAEALSLALAMASKNDLVCVAGSLFVVAEALDYAAKISIF